MSKDLKLALAIDLGTEFTSLTLVHGGTPTQLTFSGDGAVCRSAIYTGASKPIIGRRAVRAAVAAPDKLFLQPKRGLPVAPHEPWKGGPTPIELMGLLIGHAVAEAKRSAPDIEHYLSGSKDRDELTIAITIPAQAGLRVQASLDEAARLAGLDRVDVYVPEPVAAVHSCAKQLTSLREGDRIAVIDVGGGTTDISVLKYARGSLQEELANLGIENLAGLNFTTTLARHVAKELKFKWHACYDPETGLDLSHPALKNQDARRLALKVYEAAESAKADLGSATDVAIPFENGAKYKEVTVTQDEFRQLNESNYNQIADAVRQVFDQQTISWTDVNHVILCGGSATLIGLRGDLADATGRAVDDVWINSDAFHAISSGAGIRAWAGEATSAACAGGLAILLYDPAKPNDPDAGCLKWLIGTGQAVPADGLVVEKTHQVYLGHDTESDYELGIWQAKPGLKKVVAVDDHQSLGPISEGLRITTIRFKATLPAGENPCAISAHITPNGRMNLGISFPQLPLEPLTFALTADLHEEEAERPRVIPRDLQIILDTSGSMSGNKLDEAKRALEHVVSKVSPLSDVRTGLIHFGGEATELCPLQDQPQAVLAASTSLVARGGTPLAEALRLAADGRVDNGREYIGVIICDGFPNSVADALAAAKRLKRHPNTRLMSIGIGREVGEAFLRDLASTPNDYRLGDPGDLISMLDSVLAPFYVTN